MSLILISLSLTACGDPVQKFKVSVVDESNTPMKGVEVAAWFNKKGKSSPLDSYKVAGSTDADGFVELQGETVWYQTSVSAEPEGFYKSMKYDHWTIKRDGNRWEPWPVEVNLVMKKIRNPKPMYVVKFDGQIWLNFPDKQLGPFGFDLMAGDWVRPNGKGEVPDLLIEGRKDDPNDTAMNPKGKILLSFSNPADGIISMKDTGGSILVGPSMVPSEGYQNQWEFTNWKPHPTEPKLISWDFGEEVFVVRVRTKLDEFGKVESSHYGKFDGRILGRMSPSAPRILMTYYLNGAPNDPGLEWDMKTNLIQDTSRMRIPERP